jgi:hypothetical protein
MLLLAGCATEVQVKQIVAHSNASLLASRLPDSQLLVRPEDAKDDDATRGIEEFIAAHPDQKTLNGSLRVRQAIIYLNRRQYNLADAAFKEAEKLGPPTSRDQALIAIHPSLIWWHENNAPGKPLLSSQRESAAVARRAFVDEAMKRAASPDIRDFLAEVSVWIGLLQFASVKGSEQKQVMEQTVNDYAFIFDEEDLKWLCKPPAISEKKNVPDMVSLRRRTRAEAVLDTTARYATDLGASKPQFLKAVLQELIAPTEPTAFCDRRFPKGQ